MAATLKVTGFHDAVDYKIIQCTNIEDTTTVVNATGGAGTLYAAYIDSANASANLYLHILDGKDTTLSEIVLKGSGTSIRSLQIPTGYAFDMLNFWVSSGGAEDNTGSFSGSVDITLVCT